MPTTQRIYKLFQGLDRAHGGFEITHSEQGKLRGKAYTKHEPVTLALWGEHLEGKHGLGIVPINDDAMSRWGVIDIDDNSINHVTLEAKIKKYKLPLVLCRSKSGGAHVFIFTSEFVPAQDIRAKLAECATGLGFSGVEIFPKQSKLASQQDVGNWLNMPYFDVSGTQKQTLRYCIKDGKAIQDLALFLDYAESKQITHDELNAITIEAIEEFKDAPPCLQYLTKNGFPSHKNNGLFSMGVFARKKFGDNWESKIDEYNRDYMGPGSSKEVQQIIKSLNKKTYVYMCEQEPLVAHCNKSLCRKVKYGIGDAHDGNLDVAISGLQKLMTNPPIWFISVQAPDGAIHRLEIDSTNKMLSQFVFNTLCVEKLNILPYKVKPEKWSMYIRKALSTVEEIEAPKEASAEGILFNILQDYLVNNNTKAQSKEEIAWGKPWLDADTNIHYFQGRKFLDYATLKGARWFNGWKPGKFYASLRPYGLLPDQIYRVGRVWKIDADKFDKPLTKDDMPPIDVNIDDDVPF